MILELNLNRSFSFSIACLTNGDFHVVFYCQVCQVLTSNWCDILIVCNHSWGMDISVVVHPGSKR